MKSPTLALMEEAGVPKTRENFLNLAFLGNPPSKLDPEEEAQLPSQFQDGFREMNKKLQETSTKKQEKAAKAAEQEKTIQPDTPQDITIGGGAEGTEQKFKREQKMLDELDDQQYGGQRKSNLL